MTVAAVVSELERIAPLAYAEDFDNVGLLVGDYHDKVKSVLVTLDTTEEVVEEAIEKGANLIISFHPIIFSGLKKLQGRTYVERAVMKAIRHGINIYAIHTALDNSKVGVNFKIAAQLQLKHCRILIPQKQNLRQLVTYVPKVAATKVRTAISEAGAGAIGNYDHCSYNIEGTGTFRAREGANPTLGEIDKLHFEEEIRMSFTFSKHQKSKVLEALFKAHPYEEVAYDIHLLENTNKDIGMGIIGELDTEMEEKNFLNYLKLKMNTEVVRHSQLLGKKVKKVAVLGGSGSFAISSAIQQGANVFITADLKYHNFFEAEDKIILADIGHFESEQYTKNLIYDYLSEKFRIFAIFNSEINTNPVNYY